MPLKMLTAQIRGKCSIEGACEESSINLLTRFSVRQLLLFVFILFWRLKPRSAGRNWARDQDSFQLAWQWHNGIILLSIFGPPVKDHGHAVSSWWITLPDSVKIWFQVLIGIGDVRGKALRGILQSNRVSLSLPTSLGKPGHPPVYCHLSAQTSRIKRFDSFERDGGRERGSKLICF